jgi:hypothetical protein
MAVVGELKGGRSSASFDGEEKGQLASFLLSLMKVTKRAFVFGFLTDGHIIQFFCLRDHHNRSTFEETEACSLIGVGEERLFALLNATPQALGFYTTGITHNDKEVAIDLLLGVGGTAFVYKGILDSEQVCKCPWVGGGFLVTWLC